VAKAVSISFFLISVTYLIRLLFSNNTDQDGDKDSIDIDDKPSENKGRKGWALLLGLNLIYGIPMVFLWGFLTMSFNGFHGGSTTTFQKLFGLSIFFSYYGLWMLANRWIIRKNFDKHDFYWVMAAILHVLPTALFFK
jgi:hypothetical protein